MSIKLKLDGFEDMLTKIQKAGGSIDGAAQKCTKKTADIMNGELKQQMQAAGVDGELINSMPPPEIETTANRHTARVGYKKGDYDPRNPSDGYKVVFLNYGTPRRSKHGKVAARGFIQAAKKQAGKKIKKEQKATLDEILRGLNG